MVELRSAVGEPSPDYQAEQPGGIGEEDIITLVLPYMSPPLVKASLGWASCLKLMAPTNRTA